MAIYNAYTQTQKGYIILYIIIIIFISFSTDRPITSSATPDRVECTRTYSSLADYT